MLKRKRRRGSNKIAATALTFEATGMPSRKLTETTFIGETTFIANKPFIFCI